MQVSIQTPDVSWQVCFDKEVVEALADLDQSSRELYDDTIKTLQKIAENPLSGSPKTGELKGFRADHITHLVVVWELDPNIVDRRHLDDVEEVYVHGIEHHDDMTDAVKGGRKPAQHIHEMGVEFTDHDVGREVSELYDVEGLDVRMEDWDDDGVKIAGVADHGARDAVLATVPDEAQVHVGEQRFVS